MNRSFIKWVGGKSKSFSDIVSKFPKEYNRYIEPFLGSGVVFFNLEPKVAILTDDNHGLINAFKTVQKYPEEMWVELELFCNTEEEYYKIRDEYNSIVQPPNSVCPRRAALFIYLNKCGFNGLYRVNKDGKFNVPYGKRPGTPHLDRCVIENTSAILNKHDVFLACADFEKTLSIAGSGDFVYMDPPYIPEAEGSFVDYSEAGFDVALHTKLSDCCAAMSERGVLWALSNSNTKLSKKLFKHSGVTTHRIYTTRSVSRSRDGRGTHLELLFTNF